MGRKNPKKIKESFGSFSKNLKISSKQKGIPYNKMSKGDKRTRYVLPDWDIKSLKYIEYEALIININTRLAGKRNFKNSSFQHSD